MAEIHYYQQGGQGSCWSFVVEYKSCSDVSDLCHEIAIIWVLGTFAFDNLVIHIVTVE